MQTSFFDPTKLAIHSILPPDFHVIPNCGDDSRNTVSFNDMVHLIDEENTVTKVDPDSAITLHPEHVNWKRRKIEELVINPSTSKNNLRNWFIDEDISSNIFVDSYKL